LDSRALPVFEIEEERFWGEGGENRRKITCGIQEKSPERKKKGENRLGNVSRRVSQKRREFY